ncbi:MAG: hypothetical protein M1813_009667 [Trichoglossum hirsutum]|nr:MAG: hypothetical protein M1813_009667 [Trichoglossum hirsutum]
MSLLLDSLPMGHYQDVPNRNPWPEQTGSLASGQAGSQSLQRSIPQLYNEGDSGAGGTKSSTTTKSASVGSAPKTGPSRSETASQPPEKDEKPASGKKRSGSTTLDTAVTGSTSQARSATERGKGKLSSGPVKGATTEGDVRETKSLPAAKHEDGTKKVVLGTQQKQLKSQTPIESSQGRTQSKNLSKKPETRAEKLQLGAPESRQKSSSNKTSTDGPQGQTQSQSLTQDEAKKLPPGAPKTQRGPPPGPPSAKHSHDQAQIRRPNKGSLNEEIPHNSPLAGLFGKLRAASAKVGSETYSSPKTDRASRSTRPTRQLHDPPTKSATRVSPAINRPHSSKNKATRPQGLPPVDKFASKGGYPSSIGDPSQTQAIIYKYETPSGVSGSTPTKERSESYLVETHQGGYPSDKSTALQVHDAALQSHGTSAHQDQIEEMNCMLTTELSYDPPAEQVVVQEHYPDIDRHTPASIGVSEGTHSRGYATGATSRGTRDDYYDANIPFTDDMIYGVILSHEDHSQKDVYTNQTATQQTYSPDEQSYEAEYQVPPRMSTIAEGKQKTGHGKGAVVAGAAGVAVGAGVAAVAAYALHSDDHQVGYIYEPEREHGNRSGESGDSDVEEVGSEHRTSEISYSGLIGDFEYPGSYGGGETQYISKEVRGDAASDESGEGELSFDDGDELILDDDEDGEEAMSDDASEDELNFDDDDEDGREEISDAGEGELEDLEDHFIEEFKGSDKSDSDNEIAYSYLEEEDGAARDDDTVHIDTEDEEDAVSDDAGDSVHGSNDEREVVVEDESDWDEREGSERSERGESDRGEWEDSDGNESERVESDRFESEKGVDSEREGSDRSESEKGEYNDARDESDDGVEEEEAEEEEVAVEEELEEEVEEGVEEEVEEEEEEEEEVEEEEEEEVEEEEEEEEEVEEEGEEMEEEVEEEPDYDDDDYYD